MSFGEPDADGRQSLQLHALTGADARDDSATGELVLEGRTGETATADSIRLWAGRITDSFYIDLSLLAKVNAAVRTAPRRTCPMAAGGREEQLRRHHRRRRSCSRSPTTSRCCGPGPRIGVWAATKLATDAGGWRQINRAGHPMMWPIFWPDDIEFTNPANTRHPSEDVDAAAKYIADRSRRSSPPAARRTTRRATARRVAAALFPDVLSYVVGTPAVYGFAGFNGRTLADNAPEAMLSLVTGTAVPSGLKPSVAKDQRSTAFPYVVPA